MKPRVRGDQMATCVNLTEFMVNCKEGRDGLSVIDSIEMSRLNGAAKLDVGAFGGVVSSSSEKHQSYQHYVKPFHAPVTYPAQSGCIKKALRNQGLFYVDGLMQVIYMWCRRVIDRVPLLPEGTNTVISGATQVSYTASCHTKQGLNRTRSSP